MPRRDLPPKNAGLKGADEARRLDYGASTDRERQREGRGWAKGQIGGRERRKKGKFVLKRTNLSTRPFPSHLVMKSSLIWVELLPVEEGDGSIALVSRNSPNSFSTGLFRTVVREERKEAGTERWNILCTVQVELYVPPLLKVQVLTIVKEKEVLYCMCVY